jgi:hypothetical protein
VFSYVILDTPGQIEIFTWSASGAIITDAVASSLPTVVAYIIDTPRTTAPATFMSNMLYACRLVLFSYFRKTLLIISCCSVPYNSPVPKTRIQIQFIQFTVFSTRPSFLSFWFSTRRMRSHMILR